MKATREMGGGAVLAAAMGLLLASPPIARAACDPGPRYDACKAPTDERYLIDVEATQFGTRDRIRWTIPHLEATTAADVPDPQTTDYAVCLYGLDEEDDFILRYEIVAPAGLGCGRERCWTRNAKGGVAYNGGGVKPNGVASLRVKTGPDGKASLSFVGRGGNLPLTDPLQIWGGELIVELQAATSCWGSYSFNLGFPPAIRTPSRFRLRGSGP